jgi:hypothetical protein
VTDDGVKLLPTGKERNLFNYYKNAEEKFAIYSRKSEAGIFLLLQNYCAPLLMFKT